MPADRFLAWLEDREATPHPRPACRPRRIAACPTRRRRARTAGRAHVARAGGGALGDWLLRAGGGFTGRANSALVVGRPPGPLADGRRRRDRAGTPAAACARAPRCRCPAARRPTPRSPRPAGRATRTCWCSPPPLDGWPARPAAPVDLRREPDDGLAGRLPLPRHAAAAGGRARCCSRADDPVFASVRAGPGARSAGRRRPRRAWSTGWLVVTALTVAEPRTGGAGWRPR